MGAPRTGDGKTADPGKVNPRDVTFRRSAKDNVGVTSDVQDQATREFRRDAGVKPETRKDARWFRY